MSGVIVAMWSGPRNISTAMMRAWENRPDTQVIDEPFYAHYLEHTGVDHPMRDKIVADGTSDWRRVIETLTTKPESGIFYQKHITAHWLDHLPTDWLDGIEHVFLIREPEPVAASYSVKRETVNIYDLGFSQQKFLFDYLSKLNGRSPLVIDSRRFLSDPESQLRTVCEALDIDFDASMLSWPSGPRDSDGIWGSHWYDAVNQSSGFMPARSKDIVLNEAQQAIAEDCRPYYNALAQHAI